MTAVPTNQPERSRLVLSLPGWAGQAARFGVVGLLNTLVDALVYLALTRWLPFFAVFPAFAKALSYSAGVINSFYWNKNWTFRSPANQAAAAPALAKFVLVNLLGVGLNAVVMQVGLIFFGLPEGLAFVLATGLTLAWNFLASKLVVFRPLHAEPS